MDTETEHREVTLRPNSQGVDGKHYTVMLDGVKVGTVEQIMVTHDRGPRSSPIATSRTRSLRWAARPGSHWDWEDTRWRAIGRLLPTREDAERAEAVAIREEAPMFNIAGAAPGARERRIRYLVEREAWDMLGEVR